MKLQIFAFLLAFVYGVSGAGANTEVIADPRAVKAINEASGVRLGQLGKALRDYLSDHTNNLPPLKDIKAFRAALLPYHWKPLLYIHPLHGYYAVNPDLEGRELASILDLDKLPILFESEPAADGTRAVVFANAVRSLPSTIFTLDLSSPSVIPVKRITASEWGQLVHDKVVPEELPNLEPLKIPVLQSAVIASFQANPVQYMAHMSTQEYSRSRLKNWGFALKTHSMDEPDMVFPAARNVNDLKSMVEGDSIKPDDFISPFQGHPYLVNPALEGRNLSGIPNEKSFVILYEPEPSVEGDRAVLFADGSVERFAEADVAVLLASSRLPEPGGLLPTTGGLPAPIPKLDSHVEERVGQEMMSSILARGPYATKSRMVGKLKRNQTISNLKIIGLGLKMAGFDEDEVIPRIRDVSALRDRLVPEHVDKAKYLLSPMSGEPFLVNPAFWGKTCSSEQADKLVAVYEIPNELEKANVLYANGVATTIAPARLIEQLKDSLHQGTNTLDAEAESALRQEIQRLEKIYTADREAKIKKVADLLDKAEERMLLSERYRAAREMSDRWDERDAAIPKPADQQLRLEDALPMAKEAVSMAVDSLGIRHPMVAASLVTLADVFMGVEDEARALEALDLAYEIWHSLGPRYHGAARSALETIVMIRQLSGDYAGALAWFEKMDAESDESGDSKDEADAQMQKGTLLLALGQPAQAEELLLKFSEHASPAQPNYRLGLQQLTACQVLMGKTQQAALSTRKIMDLEKREVEQGLSTLIENLTPDETAHTLNLYVSYLKSLDAVAEKADQSDVENVGRMLDQSKLLIGQYAGTNTLSYAQQTLALATVQIQAGQFREAEHPLLDAKATFTQLYGEKDATIMTHLQLASVRLGLGRFAEAEADLQKILSYYRDAHGENPLVQAATQLLMANVYAVTDRPGKSVNALSSAMEAQQSGLERLFEFSNESTMRDYLQTIRPSQDMLMSLFARKQVPMNLLSQAAVNWTLRRKGLILDALCEFRRLQETLAQNEGIALKVGSLRNLRHQLANLQSDPARLMREANSESSRDKKSPRSWQEMLRVRESALQTQIDALEAELTRILHAKSSAQNHAQITWQTVRERLPEGSALVEFVRASAYDFDAVKLPADKRWQGGRYFALVLSKSNPEPALVYIGDANEIDDLVHRFRASIQDGGRSVGAVAMEVEDDQVSARPKQGHPDDSLQLSRILLAPLEKHFHDIDTLYLAPDGELNLVPFAALTEADGKFLVENRKLVYLSSGRDLLRAPEPFGSGTLIFAGPDYNAITQQVRPPTSLVALAQSTKSTLNRRSQEIGGLTWSRLPGAEAEAAEVQVALKDPQYAPVSLYTGANATEESFKNVQSPRILHVATHGYFLPDLQSSSLHQRSAADNLNPNRTLSPLELAGLAENPLLRCGMVLAGANNRLDEKATEDGWVTAEEISMINLRGTQLVVLSACETGLGDVRAGEGVYGLRRAFINAGARSLLTSLFKVPDKETCQLMGHFYRGIDRGQDAATALREAQISVIKQLRKDYGKAPIVLWAGFIQVGNWK